MSFSSRTRPTGRQHAPTIQRESSESESEADTTPDELDDSRRLDLCELSEASEASEPWEIGPASARNAARDQAGGRKSPRLSLRLRPIASATGSARPFFSLDEPFHAATGADADDWRAPTMNNRTTMTHARLSSRGAPPQTLPELVRADNRSALSAVLTHAPHRIDERDAEGWTALHVAVLAQNLDLVQVLLGMHATPHLDGPERTMPLHLAAMLGNAPIVKALLDHQAMVDAETDTGMTPLMLAAEGGHLEVHALLLAEFPNVDKQSADGMTPLLFAARNGHEKIVRALLKTKADPAIADATGVTPLMLAAQGGHATIVGLLLALGVQVDCRSASGTTALMLAASGNHAGIVADLLTLRANCTFTDDSGRTPLMLAAERGHAKVVSLLLAERAPVNATDRARRTALMLAAKGGHDRVVRALLKAQADPDATDREEMTALALAAAGGHAAAAKRLIKAEADPHCGTQMANTPLYLALHAGDVATARRLRKAGAPVPDDLEIMGHWLKGLGYEAADFFASQYPKTTYEVHERMFALGESTGQAALMAVTSKHGYRSGSPIVDDPDLRLGLARGYDWGRYCGVIEPAIRKKAPEVAFDALFASLKKVKRAPNPADTRMSIIKATHAEGAFCSVNYAMTDALCRLDTAWQVLPDDRMSPPPQVLESALAWIFSTAADMHELVERPIDYYAGSADEPPSRCLPKKYAKLLAPLVAQQASDLMKQARGVQRRLDLADIRQKFAPYDRDDTRMVKSLLTRLLGLHPLVAQVTALALYDLPDIHDVHLLKRCLIAQLDGSRFLIALEADDLGGTLPTKPNKRVIANADSVAMARSLIMWQVDTLLASVA